MIKMILIGLILLLLLGCSPEEKPQQPAYSGGCGVLPEQQEDNCILDKEGLCTFQEGF